ncbi:hypothetical protein B9Z65_970 [Elsinoe australis]|uniref:Major royal jelly protein n=1 Tax=Elsinoe australis TaxID=40998 RepID=A0A2P8AK23_9PEZI|nr:hypothetical protein B9Z65_970 [Elsinoe australis]
MYLQRALALLTTISAAYGQQIASDPGVKGPALEVAHLYYDQFPTGIAVSAQGRQFSNYPLGLDSNNTRYQVAELTSNTTESAYPPGNWNNCPGGNINYTTYPPTGANHQDCLIGVQSIAIDALDRLWILDTGRALLPNGTLANAAYGGTKLVSVNLSNNTVSSTIVLPPTTAYADSYLNDLRIDLRPNITASGAGIIYITDSSQQGRNGLVIVDIGTGESWRHLDNTVYVSATQGHFKQIWGEDVYYYNAESGYYSFDPTGSDGIALVDGGDALFWSVTGSRYLYSIATERLRDHAPDSEVRAQAAVQDHGQKGATDGLTEDSNGYIYGGSFEDNSLIAYNPANATVSTYVRDPRIGWTDSLWVANDGYLYFVENQLWRSPGYWPGTDRRVKPFVLYRVPTADNGQRVAIK